MKPLFALILSVLFASPALALDCPAQPDGASLEVTGFGEIQSGGLEYDGDVAVLFDACLKRGDWLVQFPQLRVTNPYKDARLEAARATVQTDGARGSLEGLSGPAEALSFGKAQLEIEPSFKLEGFAAARYTATAASGSLGSDSLSLRDAVLTRLGAGDATLERYSVTSADLRGNTGALSGVQLLRPDLALSASAAQTDQSGFSASGVTGRFGRNSAGSEITFSAESALRLEDGSLQFQGGIVYLFGLALPLGGVRYDPNCPLELPLLISPFAGWTVGLNGIRFSCRGNATATIIGYNLFSSQPSFAAFLSASDGPLSLFAGQRKDETLRAQLLQQPATGFIASFGFDSGINLEGTLNAERFLEARVGLAYTFSWNGWRLRPTIESGAVAQSLPSAPNTDATLVFTTAGVSAGGEVPFGPVTFSVNGASSYTLFSDGSSGAGVALAFGARLTLDAFSVAAGVRYQQQLVPAVIRRYNMDGYTRLDASARYAPSTGAPPLGFSGVRLEQPAFSVTLEYDPRGAVFVHQIFAALGTLAFYDGSILLDNFGKPFQTPSFALSPRGSYDLVTGDGLAGAVISISGVALIYDIGVFVTLPSVAFDFSFGVRLR